MEIYVKNGVIFKQINTIYMKLFQVLMEAGDYLETPMVITSAFDGKHREDSLHYKHRALDIRTIHLSWDKVRSLLRFLREKLGEDFDVIYEENPPHIHIEYDPQTPK